MKGKMFEMVSNNCTVSNSSASATDYLKPFLPVAVEHGVRDMPHAMMLLVRTSVLPRALYACQVWGPDMLQLHHAASPVYSLSCCPFASMFWGCVAA
jgi:hypothetical protein